MIVGFSLGRGYEISDFDASWRTAGLELEARWSTWDRDAFVDSSDYALTLLRRPR